MADDFVDADEDPFQPDVVLRKERETKEHANNLRAEAEAIVKQRQGAYRRVFAAADASDIKIVMDDLRRFCRGDTSAWSQDAREHALLTGRQEVHIRIKDFTQASLDELYEKYIGL